MYLRGVQYSEMESIMQFIYLGEATFYEERMDEFLAVAKSLEIKELCNAATETKGELNNEPSSCDPDKPAENLEEPTVSDQIKMRAPQERQRRVVRANGRHERAMYACEQCDYQAAYQITLTRHIQSKHEGIKYACDQCDKQFTKQGNLRVHIQSKHEGIKYACNQCDYLFTQQSNLSSHIQSKHEGINYACDQCDYQASTKGNLTSHIQSKHEGIKYACDQCDYQATLQGNLTKHIRSKHEQCL